MAGIKTAQDELAEIEQALTAVTLGGQSYTIGSRKLTRADYSMLIARKKELQAEIAAEDDSSLFSNTFVSFFDRR